MANRRMFSKDVICSDRFYELPIGGQALYLQIVIAADDDGLLASMKRLMRDCQASESDLEALIDGGFILKLDDKIYAVTDWLLMNKIQPSRRTPTVFAEQFRQLTVLEDGRYELCRQNVDKMSTGCQQDVDRMSTRCQQNVNKMSTGCQQDVDKLSTGCQQDVDRMSTGCQQDVDKLSTRCQQDVDKMSTGCRQDVDKLSTQYSIGKYSIGESSKEKSEVREEQSRKGEREVSIEQSRKENNKESNSKYYNSVIEKYNSVCKDLPEVRKSSII